MSRGVIGGAGNVLTACLGAAVDTVRGAWAGAAKPGERIIPGMVALPGTAGVAACGPAGFAAFVCGDVDPAVGLATTGACLGISGAAGLAARGGGAFSIGFCGRTFLAGAAT